MRLSIEQLYSVAEYYGVSVGTPLHPQRGYRNTSYPFEGPRGNTWYNFVIYADEAGIVDRIVRINNLGRHLFAKGLPVRCPADDRIMALRVPRQIRYGSLYYYLRGQTIPWEAYTKKHIKLLGMALASIHRGTGDMSQNEFPSVYDEYQLIVQRMQRYFDRRPVQEALNYKTGIRLDTRYLTHLLGFLDSARVLPEQRILHMDLVRGNVLYDTAHAQSEFAIDELALSGVIDFEKAAVGHRLFDVARTLAFLIVDCNSKTEAEIRRACIDSGYIRRGGGRLQPLTVAVAGRHEDVLETAITMFLLYDLYKFLRHNPYESLAQNHHFCRTRDALVARKMIHYRH